MLFRQIVANDLPVDIIQYIFQKFDLKNLINVELVHKFYCKIVRKTKWNHLVVKVPFKYIHHVTSNYNFMKYDLSKTPINNELGLFSQCHTLILNRCANINKKNLKFLVNVKEIDFTNCSYIALNILKTQYLENCIKLNFSGTFVHKIDHFFFTCVRYIDLSCCYIADDDLIYLKNCHTVILDRCKVCYDGPLITNIGIAYLENCVSLSIFGKNAITYDGLKNLKNLLYLNSRYFSDDKNLQFLRDKFGSTIISKDVSYPEPKKDRDDIFESFFWKTHI